MRVRIEVNGKLLFINDERILVFPADGADKIDVRLTRVSARQVMKDMKPDPSLTNTSWKLVKINGNKVVVAVGGQDVHFIISAENKTLHGFAGCNTFNGGC